MSKNTLSREITKEIRLLNDRIDRKIIKGRSYAKEARRHRELLRTLERMGERVGGSGATATRSVRRAKYSPVRKSIAGGTMHRLFGMHYV